MIEISLKSVLKLSMGTTRLRTRTLRLRRVARRRRAPKGLWKDIQVSEILLMKKRSKRIIQSRVMISLV